MMFPLPMQRLWGWAMGQATPARQAVTPAASVLVPVLAPGVSPVAVTVVAPVAAIDTEAGRT
jgi:hypothetical protein